MQINGDLLSIMLLYSLPASYDNFRCSMESRDDLPSADVLKVKIIEATESRGLDSAESVVTAMVGNSVRHGNREKHRIRCYRCGTEGHKANVCPLKRSENF